MSLPTDAKARKNVPLARGLLDYFPDACAAVAELSRIGNEQHNPGEPMHWAREKSTDHADCIIRHTIDRGTRDADGVRHTTKAAWRALALDQLEAERERAEQFREPVHDEPVSQGIPEVRDDGALYSPACECDLCVIHRAKYLRP
jgi:hypothetical protein